MSSLPAASAATLSARGLARFIDHTVLKPEATRAEIERACAEAREHGFFGVCVNSSWVPVVAKALQGSAVKVVAVAGFPLGAMSTEAKAFEAAAAVRAGAHEVDMVIPVGALKSGDAAAVEADIARVVSAAGVPVKVILETCLLSADEQIAVCRMAQRAGAAFVKTSTGFGKSGATVEDVARMRQTVGPQFGVKASGGVRTTADALKMIEAGATRIGASASVAIVGGAPATSSGY